MTKKRVAINGFGRIGRAAARIILTNFSDTMELVAINDPSDPKLTAHLFQFDSNFGVFDKKVEIDDENLIVDNKKIRNFSSRNIEELEWGDLEIDVVLECTGVFRTAESCQKHLDQGAKKVLLSAPAKSEGFKTIVLGVNDDDFDAKDKLVCNASCTTNCLAPLVKVLDDNFGIEHGLMTTVHSYTSDQRIVDTGHRDFRRARSCAQNIIPTTTGAAKSVGLVIPHLKGKLNGISVRVPTPTVSLTDLVVNLKKSVSVEDINKALQKKSQEIPNILGFEKRPLVSNDYKMDSRSSIIDSLETMVIGEKMVKVLSWYDNEWGYACRLVELAKMM